jgi:replicative superfamily II helicase
MSELVNGAFLEKSQIYKAGESIGTLPLQEETRGTINRKLNGRNLYRHQTDAIKQILRGENTVVATGTSSGKTLCYQLPILDDLLHDSTTGLRAIIIYPLNALVNDQLEEWSDILRPFQTSRLPVSPDKRRTTIRISSVYYAKASMRNTKTANLKERKETVRLMKK